MIGRRAFLGTMAAAPAMAQQASKSMMDVGSAAQLGVPVSSPLDMALHRHREAMSKRLGAKDRAASGVFPVDISTKVSWSPAFKAHEAEKQFVTEKSPWGMTDDELIAHLTKRGIDFLKDPKQ